MSDDVRPSPRAQGTLEKRPLVHLLAYCFERKLSGSLVFGDVDAPVAVVVLKDGEPSKTRVNGAGPWEALADLSPETAFAYFEGFDCLKDEPRADVPGLSAIFSVLRRRPPTEHLRAAIDRLGTAELVIDPGTSFNGIGLNATAQDVMSRIVQQPFTLESLNAQPALRAHVETLVYGFLITKVAHVAGAAAPSTAPLATAIAPPALASGDADASSSRMRAAVPSSSDDVPDSTDGQTPAAVGRVRLTRASQKLTPLTEEPTVISSYDDRASVPPPKRSPSPEVAGRRKEILDRAASIDRMNYFEMLGVSQDTSAPQIQAIFLTHAKRWHPDRLPPELNDVREACGRVFSRLSEASSTLCDEEQRSRYMRLLTEGGATPEDQEKIATVVEAATSFQKAEVMLKRGDVAKAEEYCALAVRLDSQPDYVALLAWVQSQKPEHQGLEAVARLEAQLTGAIDKSERCERALFYRGTLRKRLGKHEEAIDDFRRAFALNPRNLDAQREVRLFDMRKEKERIRESQPPEKKPSFIGKLFKK